MSATVLVVDDHEATLRSLVHYLGHKNFKVLTAHSAESALRLINKSRAKIDAVVLDNMLPGISGVELLRQIRSDSFEMPVIMLTSLGDTEVVINALRLGADDYLTKPFSLAELHARLRAILRRPRFFETKFVEKGDFRLDLDRRAFIYRGERIDLRPKEFDLLHFLLINHNHTVTRDYILASVWELENSPHPNTIDVHIRGLRGKIGDNDHKVIETIHKLGYRLNL